MITVYAQLAIEVIKLVRFLYEDTPEELRRAQLLLLWDFWKPVALALASKDAKKIIENIDLNNIGKIET